MLQNVFTRLRVRNGIARNFGDAIATTRAGEMLAVAQKCLSPVQSHFFLCPINLTSETVGDVGLSVVQEMNHMRIADGKVGIVSGNDRFMLDCFPKFAAVVCAPGNDRVRINRMVPVGRCGRREVGIVPIPVKRRRHGIA
jgi:hypothetical protein